MMELITYSYCKVITLYLGELLKAQQKIKKQNASK